MFGQLGYLVSETFLGMRQHRTVILPSFATIFLCSLLLTASFVVFGGVVRVLSMEKNLYAVEAFLPESLEADWAVAGSLPVVVLVGSESSAKAAGAIRDMTIAVDAATTALL